jgi:large subunit ribosomal protein L24
MQSKKLVTKPTKQRKRLFQAPAHIRHKLFAAHLSPELRGSQLVKSFPVRTGDTVRVMRGDHRGFEGKISRVDLKNYRVYVEGLTREKVDGTTIFVPIHPSKVVVTHLNLDDKWRKEILEAKKEVFKKPKAVSAKPEAKPEKKPAKIAEVKEPVGEKVAPKKKELVEEKAAEEEKGTVGEKPKEKRVARGRREAAKKKPAVKAEEKAKEKEQPKPEKKRTRRKTAKKAEGGGT